VAELILTGDINLMNVTDSAVPFALVGNEFRAADLVFGNLECCLCPPPKGHSADTEGFFADLFVAGAALTSAGVQAVGIAVVRGHTAYQIPMRGSRLPANRPGLPPQILTWADQQYLQRFTQEINVLRGKVDIVVASCHWGVGREVLQYMAELGHAAVDAGADLVIGHGPHYSLPVELYRGRPIFYGLGSFSFHTGHRGRIHGDWLGMMVRVSCEAGRITGRRSGSSATTITTAPFPARSPMKARRSTSSHATARIWAPSFSRRAMRSQSSSGLDAG